MKTKIVILSLVLCVLSSFLFGQVGGNQGQTKKVAILEVANVDGDVKRGDLLMILGSLTSAVTQIPGYKGYERRDIGSILGEQDFQRTGMVNDEQIKRIGEMEGAQYVLASEVAQMSNGQWAITAKMLDVESGEISRNAVVQTLMTDLEEGCRNLAAKLFGGGQGPVYAPSGGGNGFQNYGQQSSGSNYTETVFGIDMQMVYVAGGVFSMGATSEQGSDASSEEKPVHSVTLSDFYMGETEVTQAQWAAVMGTTVEQQRDKAGSSSLYGVGDDYPMYYVSWEEAQEFCSKLSQKTGKKYRLPTEAEWEYAARGGQKADGTKYAGSDAIGDVAWYFGNRDNKAHPVGSKKPNGLGLYDMSGNVWEWCSDWYGSYGSSSATNPQGPSSGSARLYRGGCWCHPEKVCRVSNRSHAAAPSVRRYMVGFRVVCEP